MKSSTFSRQIDAVQHRLAKLSRCPHKMPPQKDALLAEALAGVTSFLDHLDACEGDKAPDHVQTHVPMEAGFPLTGGGDVQTSPLQRPLRAGQSQRNDGTLGEPSDDGHVQTLKYLKESEARFRLIAESIKDVFWVSTPGVAEVLYVSPAYEEIWGLTCQSLYESPRSFLEAVHPADRKRLQDIVEAHPGDQWQAEYRIIRPDGEVRWIHDRGYPVYDDNGTLVYMTGVARDITDRRRAEGVQGRLKRKAKAQRSWLQTILKNTPAGICVIDSRRLRIRYANNACTELLRQYCPGGRVVGASLVDILARTGQAQAGDILHTVAQSEQESVDNELVLTSQDGAARHLRFSMVPLHAHVGHSPDIMVLLDDITDLVKARDELERRVQERTADLATTIDELQAEARERIDAEQRLSQERQRLYSLLNVLPGYVCLIDNDYAFRFVNHKFLELIGEPAGRRCYEVLRNQDHACRACNIRKVQATRQLHQWERVTRDGKTYRVWGYPFTDIDGAELVLELGMDVTHLKRLEREIVQISELEQQRFGQELHDSIGQVLTGLGFLTKALQNRLLECGSPEADSAGQIAALLKQAVVQTRFLAKGLLPVDPKMGGLCAVLDELAGSVEHVHHVSCSFESHCDLSSLDVKPAAHLYRIAQEAVNNALKHAKPGQIDIALRREGELLVLTVANDGLSPIEPLDRTKGLGLRIMAHRASALGGSVQVSARDSGGATVLCEAPIACNQA